MEEIYFDVQSNLNNLDLQTLKILVEKKNLLINKNIYERFNFID